MRDEVVHENISSQLDEIENKLHILWLIQVSKGEFHTEMTGKEIGFTYSQRIFPIEISSPSSFEALINSLEKTSLVNGLESYYFASFS